MNFAAQLRAWRKRRGETQDGAALALGVPLKTYVNWEQGRRTPRGFALSSLQSAIVQKIVGPKNKAGQRSAPNNPKAKRPRAQSRTRPARRTSAKP